MVDVPSPGPAHPDIAPAAVRRAPQRRAAHARDRRRRAATRRPNGNARRRRRPGRRHPGQGAGTHHGGCDDLDVVVGDIGQSDPPHAARHGVRRRVRGRVRQPALADPRLTRERDQPVGRQRPADDRQIRPATDEGTDRRGQVPGSGGTRLQRRERRRKVGLRDLPDPFTAIEPTQPVQAEVDRHRRPPASRRRARQRCRPRAGSVHRDRSHGCERT